MQATAFASCTSCLALQCGAKGCKPWEGGQCLQGSEAGLILQGLLCCPFGKWKRLLVVTSSEQQKELTQVRNLLSESWEQLVMYLVSWKDKHVWQGLFRPAFPKGSSICTSVVRQRWHGFVTRVWAYPSCCVGLCLREARAALRRALQLPGGTGLQQSPSPWDGMAAFNTCQCLESCSPGLCWSGPSRCGTYLTVLQSDMEGRGLVICLGTKMSLHVGATPSSQI